MYAKIIKDSEMGSDRLITFEIEFHRFILPELNTHRVFSRNYQSSRAVPIEKLIDQVKNNPAMPIHWGLNQRGMVAENELNEYAKDMAVSRWIGAAADAAYHAEKLAKIGAHKQIVNRILEPFMWTRGVITATEDAFNSFFKLRCHPDAQPEIKALAELMRDEIKNSMPQSLVKDEWHLPYVDSVEGSMENIMISTSCIAQVSYRALDDSVEKAKKIYKMLHLPVDGEFSGNPPHFSPAEHCAMCGFISEPTNFLSGNFNSMVILQYRKMLESGVESVYVTG